MFRASSNNKTAIDDDPGAGRVNRGLQRRHLAALVAIDESRSVHGAARLLGVAQPAVSRLLSEAEAILGRQVFERSSRGSRPTVRGAGVLAQARSLLRGLERLDGAAGTQRGQVTLGCIARAMHTLVPGLLEQVVDDGLDAEPPGVLRLVEESSATLWDAVSRGVLDLAILRERGEIPSDEDLATELLYDERTVVICAADRAPAPQRTARLSRDGLARHRWILPDARTSSREAFDRWCSEGGVSPLQPVIETRSFESSITLVAQTSFLSIAPESIARQHQALGLVRILPTRQPLPSSATLLVFKRASIDDPVLAAWRDRIHLAARKARTALRSRAPARQSVRSAP